MMPSCFAEVEKLDGLFGLLSVLEDRVVKGMRASQQEGVQVPHGTSSPRQSSSEVVGKKKP